MRFLFPMLTLAAPLTFDVVSSVVSCISAADAATLEIRGVAILANNFTIDGAPAVALSTVALIFSSRFSSFDSSTPITFLIVFLMPPKRVRRGVLHKEKAREGRQRAIRTVSMGILGFSCGILRGGEQIGVMRVGGE